MSLDQAAREGDLAAACLWRAPEQFGDVLERRIEQLAQQEGQAHVARQSIQCFKEIGPHALGRRSRRSGQILGGQLHVDQTGGRGAL